MPLRVLAGIVRSEKCVGVQEESWLGNLDSNQD